MLRVGGVWSNGIAPEPHDFQPGVELLEVAAISTCDVSLLGVPTQGVAVYLKQLACLAD